MGVLTQTGNNGCEEVERVALEVLGKESGDGEEEHLLAVGHLLGDIVGLAEQTVHAGIVGGSQKGGYVVVEIVGHLSHLLHIDLRHHVGDRM